jgi:hypothetical protein
MEVRYCSAKCQKKHWRVHKKVCPCAFSAFGAAERKM